MTLASRLESLLTNANQRVIQHARRFSRPYAIAALVLFMVGLMVSIWSLNLHWDEMEMRWLFINLIVGAPLAVALNAVGLKISAYIVGASMSFFVAFRICCIAICANVLPMPAGSMIQASSLASRGGSFMQSGVIVLVGNLLSLALVMMLVGAILLPTMPTTALLMLFVGLSGLAFGTVLVLKKSEIKVAIPFLVIRILRTFTMVFRIQISFLIIGVTIGLFDAALFSGAVMLGTLFSIFPAGLGVSEVLAATFALATTVAAGAAFVATALNRVATLVFAALFLGLTVRFKMNSTLVE